MVGVFGEWGSGKSTLLAEIARKFPNVPIERPDPGAPITLRIEFNAWRYEREEHLLVPLLRTIERTLDDYADAIEALPIVERQAAAPAAQVAGVGLGIHGASTAAAEAAAAKTVAARPEKRKERRDALARWVGSKAKLAGLCAIAMTKAVKIKADVPFVGGLEFAPAEGTNAVRKELALMLRPGGPGRCERRAHVRRAVVLRQPVRASPAVDARRRGPDAPRLNLVFLVDDLDRCLPEKAVEMLESIKLFLDVEGCVFVLARGRRGRRARHRAPVPRLPRRDGPRRGEHRDSLKPTATSAYLGSLRHQSPAADHRRRRTPRKIVQLAIPAAAVLAPPGDRSAAAVTRPSLFAQSAAGSGRASPADWLLDLFLDAVPPVPRKLIRAADLLVFVRQLAVRQGVV